MTQRILVIGGAGYIGSHMVAMLAEQGFAPIVFDNLSTGHRQLVPRATLFFKGDLRCPADIRAVFKKYRIDAVMHFGALSIVSESVAQPARYYENNVNSCSHLIEAMACYGVRKLIFSSSASVYGDPQRVPIKETDQTQPTHPYGWSKLMVEQMLASAGAEHGIRSVSLRYFNAAGAHLSGTIGEWHTPETHLIPTLLKVAKGEKKEFLLFGDDYPTADGTCIRDYIHVQDLCAAHLRALAQLSRGVSSSVFNVGNGRGYSVREVVNCVEKITKKKIRVKLSSRRPGDPAQLIASAQKAEKVLGWKAQEGLEAMVLSAWRWENSKSRTR